MAALVIGITGGIGSGKSTIARVFSSMGFPVYNSDDKAKEIYFKSQVKEKVIAALGLDAYNSDGSLNKKFISSKIFTDNHLLRQINSIIHPAVMQDMHEWLLQHNDKNFVLKESALLFETGLYKNCTKTILVTAPEETRIERVMKRDKTTREEVQKRIKNQLSDEEKKKLADFVIENGDFELVTPQVLAIIEKLKG